MKYSRTCCFHSLKKRLDLKTQSDAAVAFVAGGLSDGTHDATIGAQHVVGILNAQNGLRAADAVARDEEVVFDRVHGLVGTAEAQGDAGRDFNGLFGAGRLLFCPWWFGNAHGLW